MIRVTLHSISNALNKVEYNKDHNIYIKRMYNM